MRWRGAWPERQKPGQARNLTGDQQEKLLAVTPLQSFEGRAKKERSVVEEFKKQIE